MTQGWQNTVLKATATVRDALRVINDETQLQIALVVDDSHRLLGTVTDGDVRRALLAGASTEAPIEGVMNKQPTTGRLGQSGAELRELMRPHKLRQVPLLDGAGRLCGVVVADEIEDEPTLRSNPVLLMAGGLGKRLRPLTEDAPKPLLHVGGQPILETILTGFARGGFKHFYVSLNYKGEMVREYFGDGSRWGVDIEYLEETKPLGTAGAVSLITPAPEVPMIVMNGDLLTSANFDQLLTFHEEHGAEATLCVREYDWQIPFGVVDLDGVNVSRLVEKPRKSVFVNAGIYVLSPKAIRMIPAGERFDMPQLFDALIAQKSRTCAFPIHEYWLDVGRMDDYQRANSDFSEIFR